MPESIANKETGRVEAFSDGVFAIAITLLILDLRVPRVDEVNALVDARQVASGTALAWKLGDLWPNVLAYLMSFAVILVIWVNHHGVFGIIRRTDQAFLFWNGLLLMLVTIIPFPTALLAEYMSHGESGQFRVAALVYAGHGTLIAFAFRLLWRYAIKNGRLLLPGYDRASITRIDDRYRWGPVAYLLAFGLAFVTPWASVGVCLALAIYFSFEGFLGKRSKA